MNLKELSVTCFLIAAVMAASSPAVAEGAPNEGWSVLVEPYLMFPNMSGEVGIRDLPNVEVDESPSDIFNNLQMGAMLYVEVNDGNSSITSDVIYMKLELDLPERLIIRGGKAEVSQLAWEVAWLGKVNSWLDMGLAATYNQIKPELRVDLVTPGGPVSRSAGRNEEWIDPSVVARAAWELSEHWSIQVRGNVGGFGLGSDFMWQVQANAVWRFSDRMQASLGYRVIDLDFERGSGADRFVYDMSTFGPVMRFGFRF